MEEEIMEKNTEKKGKLERLRRIAKSLNTMPDVRDFWIVDSGDNVVICQNGLHDRYPNAIEEIKENQRDKEELSKMNQGDLIFREKLLQYKGYTVLYGFAANGWQLIFFLNKRTYLSLAMLEMESCLREMDEAIKGITS
jgi:hypothetical protein